MYLVTPTYIHTCLVLNLLANKLGNNHSNSTDSYICNVLRMFAQFLLHIFTIFIIVCSDFLKIYCYILYTLQIAIKVFMALYKRTLLKFALRSCVTICVYSKLAN